MKVKFDAYVLWPLAKKFQNWIVDRSTARDFTVFKWRGHLTITASRNLRIFSQSSIAQFISDS